MSPVDYHAWTHRPKALGGTDPISLPGNESAGFFGWEPDSTGAVPSTTWTSVGSIGSALATCVTLENDTNYSVNENTCVISWTQSALIYVIGQVRFASALNAGEAVGVRLQFGGGVGATDVVSTHIIPGGGLSFGSTSHFYGVCGWTFGIGQVELQVYHDNAASRTFESADLSCFTVCLESDAETVFH